MKQKLDVTWFNAKLNELKCKPICYYMLSQLTTTQIHQICKAWVLTEIRLTDEGDKNNLWSYVEFDIDKFKAIADVSIPGAFASMVKANVLLPDGSINPQLKQGDENDRT